jgi:hypothetical protein
LALAARPCYECNIGAASGFVKRLGDLFRDSFSCQPPGPLVWFDKVLHPFTFRQAALSHANVYSFDKVLQSFTSGGL